MNEQKWNGCWDLLSDKIKLRKWITIYVLFQNREFKFLIFERKHKKHTAQQLVCSDQVWIIPYDETWTSKMWSVITKMNRYLCYFSKIMKKFPHFWEKAQKDRPNGTKCIKGCSDKQENIIAKMNRYLCLLRKYRIKFWFLRNSMKKW